MGKIWFIGLVIFVVLISGCYGPKANINTTIQQGGAPAGGTPAATVVATVITPLATETPYATATITPIATTPYVTTTPNVTVTATPSVTTTMTPIATGTPAAASVTVEIKAFAFNPVTITVPRGTTVIWVNNDTTAHTVTSTTGDFDSNALDSGQSFRWTFNQPGTFEYGCTIHPNDVQHGKVIVT